MIDSCLNYFNTSLLQNSMLTDHNSAAAILNGGLGIPGWNMPGLHLGGIIGDLNPYTRQQQPQPQDILPTTEAPSRHHLWSVRRRQLSVPHVHSSTFESRVFCCCWTNSLEFTAWWFMGSSCWLSTFSAGLENQSTWVFTGQGVLVHHVLCNRTLQTDICYVQKWLEQSELDLGTSLNARKSEALVKMFWPGNKVHK